MIKLSFSSLITGNVTFHTYQDNHRSDFNFTKPAIKHFIRHLCINQLLAYNIFYFALVIYMPSAVIVLYKKCSVYYCLDNVRLRRWAKSSIKRLT